MTGGFAYVPYATKYDDAGVETFIANQDRAVYGKNPGKESADIAKSPTGR
jgi:hypothetical protein